MPEKMIRCPNPDCNGLQKWTGQIVCIFCGAEMSNFDVARQFIPLNTNDEKTSVLSHVASEQH